MKHLLLTTIAAVLLMGCGPSVDIHQAAKDGNIKAAKEAIAAGADVNAKMGGGTPLHWAAQGGHKKIIELLIAEGADVNAKVDSVVDGSTPLHQAALGGHKKVAELLITKGADVNAKDDEGSTPLNFAIKKPKIADLLRKHGGKTSEELK
jgi:ankyrin repeat protein